MAISRSAAPQRAAHRRCLHVHVGGHDETVRLSDRNAAEWRDGPTGLAAGARGSARDFRWSPTAARPLHAAGGLAPCRRDGGSVFPGALSTGILADHE